MSGQTTQSTQSTAASTSLTPIAGLGQFTSLSMLNVQWAPSLINLRSVSPSPGLSAITIYFDNKAMNVGWAGIGFGYTDFRMDGGKKAVALHLTTDTCSITFYTLTSHVPTAVPGDDPWGITPSCSVLGVGLASIEFTIGGDSQITLPPQGTKMYALLAGGQGVAFGAHGPHWDYKKVDFLSVGVVTSGAPVNPWYLAHGVIFIVTYAILMPLTAFLIMINHTRFYNTHKVLGVVIVVLLIVGWVVLSGAKLGNAVYAPFSSSEWGTKHRDYGSIGCWVAVGVCSGGVLLWYVRLPKTMKKAVRFIHGLAGILLSFYGPFTVWTGWLLLQPAVPAIGALDSTPLVWMALAAILTVSYVGWYAARYRKTPSSSRDEKKLPTFSAAEIQDMVHEGRLILLVDGLVVEIPKSFTHPGGRAVMEHFAGQEISEILAGTQAVSMKGRMRYFPHSEEAYKLAREMKIGESNGWVAPTLVGEATEAEAPKTVGTIVSVDRISKAVDLPVKLFKFTVDPPPTGKGAVGLGSRVYLSMSQGEGVEPIQRPYTVCRVKGSVIEFAIKIYPDGRFTSKLNKLKPGDSLSVSKSVPHPPIPSDPRPPSMVVFIAGGTGMVPMISYFKQLETIALGGILLWWVRNELDLFLVDELRRWAGQHKLQVKLFYTQPINESAKDGGGDFAENPLLGRVCAQGIKEAFGGALPVHPGDVGVLMSGPAGFIQATESALAELGIPETRILSLD